MNTLYLPIEALVLTGVMEERRVLFHQLSKQKWAPPLPKKRFVGVGMDLRKGDPDALREERIGG